MSQSQKEVTRRDIQAVPERNKVRVSHSGERKSTIFRLIDFILENFSGVSPR